MEFRQPFVQKRLTRSPVFPFGVRHEHNGEGHERPEGHG